jgi:hypothetical protein
MVPLLYLIYFFQNFLDKSTSSGFMYSLSKICSCHHLKRVENFLKMVNLFQSFTFPIRLTSDAMAMGIFTQGYSIQLKLEEIQHLARLDVWSHTSGSISFFDFSLYWLSHYDL